MKEGSFPPDDSFHIRCPRLGHQITFSYCRSENHGLPCFKTLDCWHTHFEVAEFLRKELPPDTWQKVFASPPKPKLISLVELIEQAKKRAKEDS
jgi:hypothetical protein